VLDDGELREHKGLYGLDANQVLLEVMDTDVRNSEVQKRLISCSSICKMVTWKTPKGSSPRFQMNCQRGTWSWQRLYC
jgi:hypothetical protein